MNREFRLALLHDWTNNSPRMVIDFTRYDLKAEEPKGPAAGVEPHECAEPESHRGPRTSQCGWRS